MAVLDSCPKHNMVAYLEKSEGNAEFHEVIDFLTCSSIHHAFTVSPVVSTTFAEQFWTSAKSKIINNVRHITAKVAGKSVSISEASIRNDLLFDDADGIDSLPNQTIFDAIQQMGYEGDLTECSGGFLEVIHPGYMLFGIEAQIKKLKKQAKPVIHHHRAWMQSVSLKQRLTRKRSSKKQWVHKESVLMSKGKVLMIILKKKAVTQTTQPPPTSTIFGDDETIAKTRPTSTSHFDIKASSNNDPKGQGKKKIEEEDETESESDEEWEGEEERNRLAEEKATNEALIRNYDDIKARIEADRLLAEKLQEEEREQFTIEERAKFLHDTIAAQRKFLAQQRSEAIRNRPPTKNQLRNQMMTY
ncbi:hypothetical protein Tco_0663968 [Tanacetum coccineum]